MNKQDKINNLIKLADYLDNQGNEEGANFIDNLIAEEGSLEELEVPEDEYNQILEISKALAKSLE